MNGSAHHAALVERSAVSLSTGQMKALLDVRDTDVAGYQAQLNQLARALPIRPTHCTSGASMRTEPGQAMFTYNARTRQPHLRSPGRGRESPADCRARPQLRRRFRGRPDADLQNAQSYSAGVAGRT